MAKSTKKAQYPKNLAIKKQLQYGDVRLLARKTKYAASSIYMIVNGHRPMPDDLAKAIVAIVSERQAVRRTLASLAMNDEPE